MTSHELDRLNLEGVVFWDCTGSGVHELKRRNISFYSASNELEIYSALNNDYFPLLVYGNAFDNSLAEYLAECIWAKGNICVIFDEADLLFFQRDIRFLPRVFQLLITQSRHRNLSVILLCRRPVEVPATIRALASQFIVFHLTHERDISELESCIGEPLPIDPRSLSKGQFFFYP